MNARLSPIALIDLRNHIEGMAYVHRTFYRGSILCEECSQFHATEESHPYGEGSAPAFNSECRLLGLVSPDPMKCPAYVEFLGEVGEEVNE